MNIETLMVASNNVDFLGGFGGGGCWRWILGVDAGMDVDGHTNVQIDGKLERSDTPFLWRLIRVHQV